jgi:2'-5' RNA ligase
VTRAFLAVVPPTGVLDAVSERVAALPLPAGARVATREQWHITVQFLGDHADIDAVATALATEPVEIGPGELQLGGGVVFGNARRARVLAIGLNAGREWMSRLATAIADRLAPLGYARDSREEFRPHLTIARFRVPSDLRAPRDALGNDAVGAAWTVSEVVLVESIMRPDGARHVARASLPVGQAAP